MFSRLATAAALLVLLWVWLAWMLWPLLVVALACAVLARLPVLDRLQGVTDRDLPK